MRAPHVVPSQTVPGSPLVPFQTQVSPQASGRLPSAGATAEAKMPNMRVEVIRCLEDNFAYLLVCEGTSTFAVVDASESEKVLAVALPLSSRGAKPVAILSTHHHWDHVGGNEELAALWKVPVFGSTYDAKRVPALTDTIDDGGTTRVGDIRVRALFVPGHTLGALAYVCEDDSGAPPCVFTGDTLFVAGAGRLFEGTAEQMHASLRAICALPAATRVYCGHEYTQTNLRFAKTREPESAAIDARISWAAALRDKGQPTVPSTVGDELATNPFVRAPDGDALARVRGAKDAFK